jgi:stage II sporulation protein R
MMRTLSWTLFALVLLMMSWEEQRTAAAIFTLQDAASRATPVVIPDESIRLRIIANSDLPADQLLKREVRDRVNSYIGERVTAATTIEEARSQIARELPIIRSIVEETIAKRGYTYSTDVTLGAVEFPTKMYGQMVYPAGTYEALRVTIGAGLGQNWWCVLFPPLCFVDIATGDAISGDTDPSAQTASTEIQAKFFVIEWLQKVMAKLFT